MEKSEASETYVLRQTAPNTQELTSISNTTRTYDVVSRETGGFMNKKPHMVITRQQNGMKYDCAEVRFDNYSSGTTIVYKGNGVSQSLALESSLDQRYECRIQDALHWWQPTGPSRRELELTNTAGESVALFTYANEVALTTGARTGSKKQVKSEDVGKLQILQRPEGGMSAAEQILCTALAVIERGKRRAANVGRQGSAYKQGACCGITNTAHGGGL
jgi:hypothetical protein